MTSEEAVSKDYTGVVTLPFFSDLRSKYTLAPWTTLSYDTTLSRAMPQLHSYSMVALNKSVTTHV